MIIYSCDYSLTKDCIWCNGCVSCLSLGNNVAGVRVLSSLLRQFFWKSLVFVLCAKKINEWMCPLGQEIAPTKKNNAKHD